VSATNKISPHILLFDDEGDIRELCSLILSSRGYTVSTCDSSNKVLEAVENARPDLIFMDNWIPGVGGIEATRQIKSHPLFHATPVVLLSANADLHVLAMQAGADGYISKPFEISDLEEMIHKTLNNPAASAA
jgi:two-component system cell cycle response regulator DivK